MSPAPSPVRRTPMRLVLALVVAAAFAALTVAPAQAAAYRYWGFYQLTDGKWAFAQKGSDQITPADGSVDGWRFAVGDANASRLPRAVADFKQICGTTPVQAGKKRVGLVIDFGRAADAPDGADAPDPKGVCAVVSPDANSTEVLKTAGDLRTEKGLVCGVDGYPADGCGGEVTGSDLTAAVKAPDTAITLALPAQASASSSGAEPTGGAATPGAADTAAPTATPTKATDATATSSTSVGTTIAYMVAALALVALGIFLLLRQRAARKKHV